MKKIFSYLGIFILLVLTGVVTYILAPRPFQVHYHANMAAYMDGKAWDFSKDIYMEEVSRCNVTTDVRPEDRIHLHENNGNLVHVHMAASTWGDLASNLLWNFGSGYIVDDYGKMYQSGSGKNLYFFINGELDSNPQNRIVSSEDRLLIWYGTGSVEEIQKRSDSLVPKTAVEYNHKADPASCSTNNYGFLAGIAGQIHEWMEHHDSK